MIRTWTYNGITFYSEWKVRQEIFSKERVSFGEVPQNDVIEFWSQLGVTYAEKPEPALTADELNKRRLKEAKRIRSAKVAAITIEVDSMLFDGDELAQNRMLNAIQSLEISGESFVNWVLADNTVRAVTLKQLKTAFSAANKQTRDYWTAPYSE